MKKNSKKKGYTIIETMIAVSLFLVVVMIGMGALLNANLVHQKSRNMREIMDNLSFIMEDMSRNLRTGYHYRCYDGFSLRWDDREIQSSQLNTPTSCEGGGGVIVFEEAHGNIPESITDPDPNATDQWIYKIEMPAGEESYNIYKSISGGTSASWVQLNPPEVKLEVVSGFVVSGAEPFSTGDTQQPYITIKLVGKITLKNIVTPFSLQTSVSQRVIDI